MVLSAHENGAKGFFAALAHDTRLRCLMLLLKHEELCVCELTHSLGASQPHISRHLAHLRELGLVRDRREGLWIYYRLSLQIPEWANRVLQEFARGLGPVSPYHDDQRNLTELIKRSDPTRCAQ